MSIRFRLFASVFTCLVLIASCGGGKTTGSGLITDVWQEDTPGTQDKDTSSPEVGSYDLQEQDPVYSSSFTAFSDAPDGPALYLQRIGPVGTNEVAYYVMGKGLGLVAGLAFYLEYDPEILDFQSGAGMVDLGDDTAIFTRSVVSELAPGTASFGAARFCEAKMPWGNNDQCGGEELNGETKLLQFNLKLLSKGHSPLRFPPENILIRGPDRSLVQPALVGGTVVVQ